MRKMKLQHRTGCCKSEIRRAVQMLGAPLKWTVMLNKWKKKQWKKGINGACCSREEGEQSYGLANFNSLRSCKISWLKPQLL